MPLYEVHLSQSFLTPERGKAVVEAGGVEEAEEKAILLAENYGVVFVPGEPHESGDLAVDKVEIVG